MEHPGGDKVIKVPGEECTLGPRGPRLPTPCEAEAPPCEAASSGAAGTTATSSGKAGAAGTTATSSGKAGTAGTTATSSGKAGTAGAPGLSSILTKRLGQLPQLKQHPQQHHSQEQRLKQLKAWKGLKMKRLQDHLQIQAPRLPSISQEIPE